MRLSLRETAAALLLCALTFTAAGKPGMAFTLDKPAGTPLAATNLPAEASVPAPDALLPTPAPAPARPLTLAAAVDAQPLPEEPGDELRCLASAIYFEAKSEPLMGQLAVAEVIINRSQSGRFPRTLCEVVKQRGQFAFVAGGEMPAIGNAAQFRTALAIAQLALTQEWESPASEALYFHAARVAPSWGKRRVAAIGRHIFYR